MAYAQDPGPEYAPLTKAYASLKIKDYDSAIHSFLEAIEAAPTRPAIRKDLAYTYLKVGETQSARDQFGEAMRLNPADFHVSLEYAFLCFESQDQAVTFKATARRIFDRIRTTGDPASRATAEQAFQNIDTPLKSGIERWTAALALSPDNFSAHYDLAILAEERDELELAAEHYLKAWHLLPERKSVLLDLGRVRKNLNQLEDANAALLAASRGGEPRAAELARELLPTRYPFVYEFRRALALDPKNAELHRELAYLLMRMGEKGEAKPAEAEAEFRAITDSTPSDLLSAAQLGFLYLSRNDKSSAMPLLQRVLQGPDDELANRVRSALHMP
ncbi:MAG: tetratricopeptide repeat protein, partial [Acidobacteriota bacterium]|nr:tetratricopeptide repeat protein [Acidobacteriota bacterium]